MEVGAHHLAAAKVMTAQLAHLKPAGRITSPQTPRVASQLPRLMQLLQHSRAHCSNPAIAA